MVLLDSNIFIYAIQPEHHKLREWLEHQTIAASAISLVEVLGYHGLNDQDKNDLQTLFEFSEIFPVSDSIIEQAIDLRQQKKLSLGDALIAATALDHQVTLVTRNIGDFNWINQLNVHNPLKE